MDYKTEIDTQNPDKDNHTTLFLNTDWNQIDLYKLYRQCPDKEEFVEYCVENYGKSNYDKDLISDPREINQILRVLLKKFKKKQKSHGDGS